MKNFDDNLGGLFDEAFSTSTDLRDSFQADEARYSNFTDYCEGGLKKISLCHSSNTNRQVVMATLKDSADPNKVEVFLREAKLNASLQHPNIVPVYDVGLDETGPWFTMKFIAGKSLREIILEQTGGDNLKDINSRLDVFLKVCDAIAYAHSLGVIHLDIKPDNVRISEYGDVVVCDWGLADVVASCCDELLLEYCSVLDHDIENHTLHGTVKGSPGFMAPEQTTLIKARKGFHTDIFSLGALLYSLLTDDVPFKGDTLDDILQKTAKCDFPIPSSIKKDIPSSLEAVCLKAMALSPDDRYQSVETLQADILAYRNGFATHAEDASFIKLFQLLFYRHKALSMVSLLALGLTAILSVVLITNLQLSKENAEKQAEKLRLEKEFHVQMGVDSAPLFMQRAEDTYVLCHFDESLRFADNALDRDDSKAEVWNLKGKLHFIREEFTAAAEALKKAGKLADEDTLAFAERYSKLKPDDSKALSIPQYLTLLAELRPLRNGDIFWKVVHYKAYEDLSIEDRIEFCRGFIKIVHGKRMKGKLNFHYDASRQYLDLSNNPWLKDIKCFQNFPAKHVNLSNTGVFQLIGLRAQPITELDISNSAVIELHSLSNKSIIKLNLSNNSIYNLTSVNSLPLEVLHIQNTPIKHANNLVKLKKLRELHLHEGQLSQQQLDRLDPSIKIVYQPNKK